jgi:hypothetical protein
MYVGDYANVEVPDIHKYNSHKHSRVVFLFNDMVIITKPKHNNTKFELRYAFQLYDVTVDEIEDNICKWKTNYALDLVFNVCLCQCRSQEHSFTLEEKVAHPVS